MPVTFLHTADWQLGKPFAGVGDEGKRARLQQERIACLQRIAAAAREHAAAFVLVAGDLFDSPRPTKATVSAACSAIGAMGVPVLAIPGNHDHGGPGSLWEQPFFLRERDSLAPNLQLLLEPAPYELPEAVLFPCPLRRRREPGDPTAWLRTLAFETAKPRILLAHGSIQGFSSADEEEQEELGANLLRLDLLPEPELDYLALGDWHGTKRAGAKAWYAGTPEPDRFPKGEANDPGHVLKVTAARGLPPEVEVLATAGIGWHQFAFDFSEDSDLARLEALFTEKIGARTGGDLLKLDLAGGLGIDAAHRLDLLLDAWQARLLRLKLSDRTRLEPTLAEMHALTERREDPLIARVAARLVEESRGAGEEAAIARLALRELHAACQPAPAGG